MNLGWLCSSSLIHIANEEQQDARQKYVKEFALVYTFCACQNSSIVFILFIVLFKLFTTFVNLVHCINIVNNPKQYKRMSGLVTIKIYLFQQIVMTFCFCNNGVRPYFLTFQFYLVLLHCWKSRQRSEGYSKTIFAISYLSLIYHWGFSLK